MSKAMIIETVGAVLDVIETRINTAIAGGKAIGGASTLAKEIAPQFALTPVQVVAIIGMYLARRTELESARGKGGGIRVRKIVV